ncbi:hypothetical protein [Methylocystis sp.]|uniref:hypothetical protein n=1 Tax=Methylocystis sp. TaxID=1911079 RepID=UPI0025CFD31A|nr:hypothetical protein [Methylocystis sp.]
MNVEQASRAGARAGLLGEGAPQGFDRWPTESQLAFTESYGRGRHCRRVAEGKEHATAAAPSIPSYATTREQLAAEFRNRSDLQQEFLSETDFVAFALAERSGKLRILRRAAS